MAAFSRGVVVVGIGALGLLVGAGGPTAWGQGAGQQAADPLGDEEHQQQLMARYETMVQFNLESDRSLPAREIDAQMQKLADLETGDRIAAWADYFWRRGDARYHYGRDPGGYVTEGRLIDDFATDCVLFFYRMTELGRSTSAVEAVQFAYGTRFHTGSLQEVVDDEGRVDYDNPVHLDYSEEILNSGIWGRDITAEIGTPRPEEAGSSRYPPGSLTYVPSAQINLSGLRSGDVLFFISNEKVAAGRAIRDTGAIIGHLGIASVEEGQVHLIHPAARPLAGIYEGGRIEKVLLKTYLERVDTFKGVKATRIVDF